MNPSAAVAMCRSTSPSTPARPLTQKPNRPELASEWDGRELDAHFGQVLLQVVEGLDVGAAHGALRVRHEHDAVNALEHHEAATVGIVNRSR